MTAKPPLAASACASEKTGWIQRSSEPWSRRRYSWRKIASPIGRDQRRLRGLAAQRPEHEALGREAVHRADRCDQSQYREQRERQRADADERQRGDADEGRVGADHRDLAEREVDPADDRVDQRVADREQAVEAADRDRVDRELQRIEDVARPRRSSPAAPPSCAWPS